LNSFAPQTKRRSVGQPFSLMNQLGIFHSVNRATVFSHQTRNKFPRHPVERFLPALAGKATKDLNARNDRGRTLA
jgi:hypothetical protein